MIELPVVSIITPSYNQALFLEQTINSVLEQNYPRLEYFIIDGGSADSSKAIIQKYANQLSGWVSEKDQGQADAINKGIKLANGEVIAWLNSDDVYRPGAIFSAIEALLRFPEAGFVFSDVDSIDDTGETFNRMTYGDWKLQDLMKFHIIGQPGVFMRRSVLKKAGYLDLNYSYLLDHHLWLRIGLQADIQYIPDKVWAAARIHPASKNVSQGLEFGKEALRLAEWIHSTPDFLPISKRLSNEIWAGAHRLNAFYMLNDDKPTDALKAYGRSFHKDPFAIFSDWRRILFAIFAPLRLDKIRKRYLDKRKEKYNNKVEP